MPIGKVGQSPVPQTNAAQQTDKTQNVRQQGVHALGRTLHSAGASAMQERSTFLEQVQQRPHGESRPLTTRTLSDAEASSRLDKPSGLLPHPEISDTHSTTG